MKGGGILTREKLGEEKGVSEAGKQQKVEESRRTREPVWTE